MDGFEDRGRKADMDGWQDRGDHLGDDGRRAGAAVRRRAEELTRAGDGPQGVVRLRQRRRALQGGGVGLAVVVVAGLILTGGPTTTAPTIDPVAPVDEAAPTPGPTVDANEQPSRLDVTAAAICDADDLAVAPAGASTAGMPAAAAPRHVAGAPLVVAEGHAYALRDRGGAAFARFETGNGWHCLPSPALTGPRLGIAGPDGTVLAVSAFGAAWFDPADERWTATRSDGLGAAPLAGVWTGDEFLVVLAPASGDRGSTMLAYDPARRSWGVRHAPPFTVNRDYHTSLVWDGQRALLFGNHLDTNNRAAARRARLAAFDPVSHQWEQLPDSPLSPQAARAVVVGDRLVAVDYEQQSASFDLVEQVWSEPVRTGIAPSECSPGLASDGTHAVMTACRFGAVLDGSGTWTSFDGNGWLRGPAATDGRAWLWRDGDDGTGAELLEVDLSAPLAAPLTAAQACAAITDFATRIVDTGRDLDDPAVTPTELAEDVDVVASGRLTGAVGLGESPGPAGESYVDYEIDLVEVVKGAVGAGGTVLVSIAVEGADHRDRLAGDVPVGAEVVVFAHEVSSAPGNLVVAEGQGLAVACADGPPLGLLGSGPGWDGLTSLDDLIDAARP